MRYYKIDIVKEGFSNKITWRRFILLLDNLPHESAFLSWLTNKENFKFISIYTDDNASIEI